MYWIILGFALSGLVTSIFSKPDKVTQIMGWVCCCLITYFYVSVITLTGGL